MLAEYADARPRVSNQRFAHSDDRSVVLLKHDGQLPLRFNDCLHELMERVSFSRSA